MGKSNNKKIINIILATLATAILIFSFVITYFPSLGLPSWSQLFQKAGLTNYVDSRKYDFSAHYIDIGQGDCELIISGDDVVLIDSGDIGSFSKIKSYLDFQGIKSIDYFILTHPHSDHIGSASEILADYEVENVIMPRYSEQHTPTTEIYKQLVISLNQSKTKVIAAKAGECYELKNFSFIVLSPAKEYDELNNSSVVIKCIYKNSSFLFCGDAEKKAEKDIINSGYDISADVIKLGHHGSYTSSSSKFMMAVNPKYAVISCGKNNKYNHPNQPVLDFLIKHNIDYKRTDFNGTIVAVSDGKDITFFEER
ncbi:MAG: ComEC/Rec2 family competence protein [Oscillospiraceae bacterium]